MSNTYFLPPLFILLSIKLQGFLWSLGIHSSIKLATGLDFPQNNESSRWSARVAKQNKEFVFFDELTVFAEESLFLQGELVQTLAWPNGLKHRKKMNHCTL